MQPELSPIVDGGQASTRLGSAAFLLRRLLPAAILIGLVAGLAMLAGMLAERRAADDIAANAAAGLPLAVAALRGELEKQRTVPAILSDDAGIRELLERPEGARVAAVNERLAELAAETRAAVIYILDRDGLAVAASNHREPTSFVGSDYRFRRYYDGAIRDGAAEQYALGTVSNQPGVYFSHRVDLAGGETAGVVVVKVELAAVEADWRAAGRPVYVTDARGIVLATSVADWRFRTLRPLSGAEAADIRESLQFGEVALDPLAMSVTDEIGVPLVSVDAGDGRSRFVAVSAPVEGGLAGWRLHLLAPADQALSLAKATARSLAGLTLSLVAAAGLLLMRRLRQNRRRVAERARAAADLEARVASRTSELSRANLLLVAEIAEREKAEAHVVSLREDLIQANRLASLGQITAGVAHEIAQPLAAIRTYAENAGRYLARGDAPAAGRNLGTVVGLTERIGAITETLRSFSRRATGEAGPLALAEPIEGAKLILKSRLREAGVAFECPPVDPALMIVGNRIRLEQVLVNLLRNAIEALAGRPDPQIALRVDERAEDVVVHVDDNGPGIDPEIMARLFAPFSTTKPKGLGLGLVISSDIVAEFGGTLSVENRADGGARFEVRLKRVTA